jgi:hypothetical protein
VQRIGDGAVQRVEVLVAVNGQGVLGVDQVKHVLFHLGFTQVRVQEVVSHGIGSLLQFAHTVCANGLNNICTDCTKWHIHLRSFYSKISVKARQYEEALRATIGEAFLALGDWLQTTVTGRAYHATRIQDK